MSYLHVQKILQIISAGGKLALVSVVVVFFLVVFFLLVCSMGWQGIKNFSANPSGQNPGFFLCWCEFSY